MDEINVCAKIEAHIQQRSEKRERKEKRRKQRKCFWTKPLGHKYIYKGAPTFLNECVGCGKTYQNDWY